MCVEWVFLLAASIPHTHTHTHTLNTSLFLFSILRGSFYARTNRRSISILILYPHQHTNTPKYVLFKKIWKKKKEAQSFLLKNEKREKLSEPGRPGPAWKVLGKIKKRRKKHSRRLIITLYVVVRDAASCQNRAFLLAVHFVGGKIEEGADGRMRGHVAPSSILVRPQRAGYCRNIEIERGQIVVWLTGKVE